ncbi:hydroxyacylglutathione hydrolase [Buchnera aphidicola]|nr:hydroxyacylglutathione hydrolase [Buchnera aphidicola]
MIFYVRSLKNNYIWILSKKENCIIVDPGESFNVLNFIKKKKLILNAILLTHYHQDHVFGVKDIILLYPNIPIYGPIETKKSGTNTYVFNNDIINIMNVNILVLHTPGHTKGHVSYFVKPYFFCGDTLFSGGCGYTKYENLLDMFNSLKLISQLQNNTAIFCSHEYTKSNIEFFCSILKKNKTLKKYLKFIENKKRTIPTILKKEKTINIFLCTYKREIKKNIFPKLNVSTFDLFRYLRIKKNNK